ncbi:MAG: hypothetical protein ACOYMN_02810 [Roseimicrobium sp.]
MKHIKHPIGLATIATGLLLAANVLAVDCEKVAAEVRAAIEANPSKVLVTVEDAMVANESCACDIVKAAIEATNANAELSRQIMLTATNVAPNLSQKIEDCTRGLLAVTTPSGGKEVREVSSVQPNDSGSDYKAAPSDIRGAYLIQPSSGGIVLQDCKCDDKTKTVVKRTPPKHCEPQSPSTASHK